MISPCSTAHTFSLVSAVPKGRKLGSWGVVLWWKQKTLRLRNDKSVTAGSCAPAGKNRTWL